MFSDKVKTEWSELMSFKSIIPTLEDDSKLDKLKLVSFKNLNYKTYLNIKPPFFYKHGYLILGSKTIIDFASFSKYYISDKVIYYRFRKKNESKEKKFYKFNKPFKVKTLFFEANEPYILEFYAVVYDKYKENLKNKTVLVSTKYPEINFSEKPKEYIWNIKATFTSSIKIATFINNTPVNLPVDYKNLIISLPKSLSNPILSQLIKDNSIGLISKKITIEIKDRLGNQNTWKQSLTFER